MSASLSQHEALVHVMVMMSAVDRNMTDDEIARIGVLVRFLPAFNGFDEDHLIHIGRECAAQLAARRARRGARNGSRGVAAAAL